MKYNPLHLEWAVNQARLELVRQEGAPAANAVETVFFNALSDMAVRAETAGAAAQHDPVALYLKFSRRVCELLDEAGGVNGGGDRRGFP